MRQITKKASKAFWDNDYFKRDNTVVINGTMKLHKTVIASYLDGYLTLDTKGYTTNTTKERLNGVFERLGYIIIQRKFQWYLFNSQNEEMIPFKDGMKLRLQ
jgi:hypothetical protein